MADIRGPLSQKDVAELTAQIAGLSEAGLPLPSGLRALGREQPSRRLRRTLDSLADALDEGQSLDEALASPRNRIPVHLLGLVRAGLRTGKMSQVLSQFASYASVGSDLRRGLVLRLSYPIIAWVFTIGLLGFVLGYLGGSFGAIYKDFGVPLPGATRVVIGASYVITQYWERFLELAGVFCAVAVVVALAPAGAEQPDQLAAAAGQGLVVHVPRGVLPPAGADARRGRAARRGPPAGRGGRG